ncbi:MAG: small multi-drug export protein [Intestinimonas sp.]|nr:small multi-drug export protein [Intestinimonas sp.]
MDLIQQWLTESQLGKLIFTSLVSMLPVVELRGGIPFAAGLGLGFWPAYLASVVGNLLPIPFIIVYIRRILQWLRAKSIRLNHMVSMLEHRAHLKGRKVTKYRWLGLLILVAIPLPGTGAWTGALVAAFLDIRLRTAFPVITAGVLAAGAAVSALTFGVAALF